MQQRPPVLSGRGVIRTYSHLVFLTSESPAPGGGGSGGWDGHSGTGTVALESVPQRMCQPRDKTEGTGILPLPQQAGNWVGGAGMAGAGPQQESGAVSCVFSRLGCDAEHGPGWRAQLQLQAEVRAAHL